MVAVQPVLSDPGSHSVIYRELAGKCLFESRRAALVREIETPYHALTGQFPVLPEQGSYMCEAGK